MKTLKRLLVDDVKKTRKTWSARLSAVGAAIMGLLTLWPDSLLAMWSLLPVEVHAIMPQQLVAGIAAFIFIGTFVSRFVKQVRLHEQNDKQTD